MSTGWYFRMNPSDSPTNPHGRDGTYTWHSPDVINFGPIDPEASKVVEYFQDTYNTPNDDRTRNVIPNTSNYIYIRGWLRSQNPPITKVRFKLWAYPTSTGASGLIPIPSSNGQPEWEESNIPVATPHVITTPFIWQHAGNTQSTHFCFICLASETSDGVNWTPYPDINNPGAVGAAIPTNPRIAWRNIAFNTIDPNSGIDIQPTQVTSVANDLTTGGIRLAISGDFPSGSYFAFEAEKPACDPDQPFNASTPENYRVVMQKTLIGDWSKYGCIIIANFKANWQSIVNSFVYWPQGYVKDPNKSYVVTISMVSFREPPPVGASAHDSRKGPRPPIHCTPQMESNLKTIGSVAYKYRV